MAVSVSLQQRLRTIDQTIARDCCSDRRNDSQRRQLQPTFNFFGRVHSIVEILEKQSEANSQTDREEESCEDGPRAIWSNRRIRRQRVIHNRNVVGLSGNYDVVLLRALKQTVEQRLIGFDLLLNDAVVDRCFILRQSFRSLLVERLAQRLLATQRLLVSGFENGKQGRGLATSQVRQLFVQLTNLLVHFLDFRCFLGGFDE